MQRILNTYHFLTSAMGWEAVFLTLACLIFFPRCVYATDDSNASITPSSPIISGQSTQSPLDEIDNTNRVHLLVNYVRQQAPSWAPGLQEKLRAPLGWIRSIGRTFGSDDIADGVNDVGEGISNGFLAPLMAPPSASQGEAMWISPSYHHKGFLPFHDAMMTGLNFRERIWDDRVQLDLKPFYGQNWVSLNGYGGAEFAIGLTRPGAAQPWGRISLRYIDGASNLMDNSGRGFDMSADLKFNDYLGVTAGVRREDQTDDLGNYVMLRWKLVGFGP